MRVMNYDSQTHDVCSIAIEHRMTQSVLSASFYTSGRSYCRNVGVIDGNYPIYPIDIFNVGKIGCNFITAITSPFLHGFGRDLNQNVGEDKDYLMRYNLGGTKCRNFGITEY